MTYTNPIIDSNIPDPSVLPLPDGSGYVLVSTSNYAQSGKGIYNHMYICERMKNLKSIARY